MLEPQYTNNNQGNTGRSIEQLWYTWSHIGLNSSTAGYRIRAASGSLKQVDGQRVLDLEQYLRYTLPEGSSFANPSSLPISFSLQQAASGERFLLNKTYTGKDGFGRPGAFFAHLIANFSQDFTTKEAIFLWGSSIWQNSDRLIGEGKSLDGLAPRNEAELRNYKPLPEQVDVLHLGNVDYEQVRHYLPQFILAYLVWRSMYWDRWQRWQQNGAQEQEPPRLYVVAPDDLVAASLLTLALSLPDALLHGLTFTTYEKSVQTRGLPMLVGTTFAREVPDNQKILPASAAQTGVVLNCYGNPSTNLKEYPFLSLAEEVARDIARRLEEPARAVEKFSRLERRLLTSHKPITVESFLDDYRRFIINEHELSVENIEHSFKNPYFAADYFSSGAVQDFMLDTALRAGTKDFSGNLASLLKYSVETPDAELSRSLIQSGMKAADKILLAISQRDEMAVSILLRVMNAVAPREIPTINKDSSVWQQFQREAKRVWKTAFDGIIARGLGQILVTAFPAAYNDFLKRWAYCLQPQDYERLYSFLRVPTQSKEVSEKFFSLLLPWEWFYRAVMDNNLLPAMIQNPESHFRKLTEELIQYYAKEAPPSDQPMAIELFKKLVNASNKQSLLEILLKSPASSGQEETIIRIAQIDHDIPVLVWFLAKYGPRYLPPPQTMQIILKRLPLLRAFSDKKMEVLSSWLNPENQRPAQFVSWIEHPNNWGYLEMIFKEADLPSAESRVFLDALGDYYLSKYDHSYRGQPQTYMTAYIRDYLSQYNPETFLRSHTPFLDFLMRNAADFPADIRNVLSQFVDVNELFSYESLTDVLKKISERVAQPGPALLEKLAELFAQHSTNTSELSVAVYFMGSMERTFSSYDRFQVLYWMAEKIRNDLQSQQMRWDARLITCVNFALHADFLFLKETPEARERFRLTFLEALLEGANSEILDRIEQLGKSLWTPKIQRYWEIYRSRRERSGAPSSSITTYQANAASVPAQSPSSTSRNAGDQKFAALSGGAGYYAAGQTQEQRKTPWYKKPFEKKK